MSNQSIIVSSNEESYITATILVPTPIKRSPMPKQRREPGPNVDLSKTSWIYEYLYRGNGGDVKGVERCIDAGFLEKHPKSGGRLLGIAADLGKFEMCNF